jgi:hypothetical protein
MKARISDELSEVREDLYRFRWAFVVLTLAGVVARAQAITAPMYSIDGYMVNYDPWGLYSLLLSNGRWGLVVLLRLREKLGYSGMDVIPSSLLLSIILFVGAGFFYARILLPKLKTAELLIFVTLFSLHPYNTEFFTFSDTTLNIALPMLLAPIGLTCVEATGRRWLGAGIGCLLMIIALSIYQLVLAHVAIVCLLAIIGQILRLDVAQRRTLHWSAIFAVPPIRALLLTAVAVVIFLVSAVAIARAYGITLAGRAALSGDFDLKEKAVALKTAFSMVFRPLPGLVSPAASALLIAVLAFAAIVILVSILRRSGVGMMLAGGLLLAVAALCSVGIPVAAHEIWLVPRVLSPFSIFTAGVITLAWRNLPLLGARYGMAAALIVLLTAYVGGSNRILYDQRRDNLWDMQQTNRIVARLEIDPQYRGLRALALVGGDWARSVPLPTANGDMNISAFATPWSKLGLVEQATGLRFAAPTAAEDKAAEHYCESANLWPAIDSVAIVGDLGIACLTHPR